MAFEVITIMHILVTGGAGFIGSHLVKALVDKGHKVYIVDNYPVTSPILFDKNDKKIFERLGYKINHIEPCDLIDSQIDVVFHLAAFTDARESVVTPAEYFKNNVVDSFTLLEACRKADIIKKFIFASSSAVYGNSMHIEGRYKHLSCHEHVVYGPINPYGASKLAFENYLKVYNESYNLQYINLRYFNVYGPGNNKGVVHKFLNNKSPIINGSGKQVRDFIHVNDVIRANIIAMESDEIGVFNVGTGVGISINELADMMDIKEAHHTALEDDVSMSIASTMKAKNALGFESQISLREGVAKLVNQ